MSERIDRREMITDPQGRRVRKWHKVVMTATELGAALAVVEAVRRHIHDGPVYAALVAYDEAAKGATA